ncbi:sugar phosphate isomerase/epimerase family protein [Pararhodonellum marinum]|uniref:sugar phosphate isomerase/epimerase family protein n=1 Tax=Pararhodonellum marinum TaxID=2755358 RepID=UPI00188E1CE0|nr:TIM barrel protein [Pararhodonellum marinum]
MKQSIITSFLSKTQDRFSAYHEPTTLRERLELVTQIDGCDGVEVVYPYETGDAAETKAWMEELGLKFAAINANIKKEPQWVGGSISRNDPALRKGAIDIIKGAKDFAKAVGAPLVTCCPLTDGYDNLFQIDYRTSWRNMIDSVAEAADYLPEIPLFIEYKYSETRVHCQLDTCVKSILLLKEVNMPGTGVTIDFGHALYAQENPAQSIAMCGESEVDFYLHTNDNDCRFDWDLVGATRNFLHYAEFLFYAQLYGYDKYYTTDASPRVFEMMPFFDNHSKMSRGIYQLVQSLDKDKYLKLMREEKAMELLQLVREEIYRI